MEISNNVHTVTQIFNYVSSFVASISDTEIYYKLYKRKGEGRSEQRGKKWEEMRRMERFVEEEKKINVIKET
jgi:hypothetical protein